MEKKLYNIIKRGIESAPRFGIDSEMFPRMFVATHADWVSIRQNIYNSAYNHYIEAVDNQWVSSNTPCCHVIEEYKDGFVYLYEISMTGNKSAKAFSHVVIATANASEERLVAKVQKYFDEDMDINGDFAEGIADDVEYLFKGLTLNEKSAALRKLSSNKDWWIEHTYEELIFATSKKDGSTLYLAG